MSQALTTYKRVLHDGFAQLAGADIGDLRHHLEHLYHPSAQWRGSHPINELVGIDAILEQVWRPLKVAMPDMERRDDIFVAGEFEGKSLVASCGHLVGTFEQDWLGIKATGKTLTLRYGQVDQMQGDRIIQTTMILDVLDVIRQSGYWPLPPSMGLEMTWDGPFTRDGVRLDSTDVEQGAQAMAFMRQMQEVLGEYDDTKAKGREGLLAMPQKDYWHDKFMWYGPCGIGTTRGLAGFVDGHQLPFRLAFPNRNGGNHYIRIGDGPYSVTGGWPSVYGNHLGGGWLGTSPTGRRIEMRVMDFYLEQEGKLRENWVPIDMLHILLQMDIDILARMRLQHG